MGTYLSFNRNVLGLNKEWLIFKTDWGIYVAERYDKQVQSILMSVNFFFIICRHQNCKLFWGWILPIYYSITSYPTIGHKDNKHFAHARSRGKLWAFRSCITSIARFRMSAHVFIGHPQASKIDCWKFNPLRLKAIVETPIIVSHIPTTDQVPKKKCKDLKLLKDASWNIRQPK